MLITKETPQPRGAKTRNQGRRDRWAPLCAPPPCSAKAQPGFCGFLPQNASPRSNHDENSGPNLRTFYKIPRRAPREDQERRRGRPRWKTLSGRSARGVGPGAPGGRSARRETGAVPALHYVVVNHDTAVMQDAGRGARDVPNAARVLQRFCESKIFQTKVFSKNAQNTRMKNKTVNDPMAPPPKCQASVPSGWESPGDLVQEAQPPPTAQRRSVSGAHCPQQGRRADTACGEARLNPLLASVSGAAPQPHHRDDRHVTRLGTSMIWTVVFQQGPTGQAWPKACLRQQSSPRTRPGGLEHAPSPVASVPQ